MALSPSQWLAILSLSQASLLACSSESPNSRTQDIFVEDQGDDVKGNARRHPADANEKLFTIDMKGCTGHLIAPELVMTAAHCPIVVGFTYRSGTAIAKGQGDDITVQAVAEKNTTLDYQILQIKWKTGYPATQFFAPSVATSEADVKRSQLDGQGDEVFTVGFPGDKSSTWGATYAQGQAKVFFEGDLYYNIGTINGNSGGGVWKKSDKMLVSLTNGGAHSLGQDGWNTSQSSDKDAWNTGVAMWVAYAQSAVLKDVFPNGKNRFSVVVSKDLFMALGEADDAAADTFTLYASVPASSGKVFFCSVANLAQCDENADGFTVMKEFKTVGDRKIFKAARSTALKNGLKISLLANDQAGSRTAQELFSFSGN